VTKESSQKGWFGGYSSFVAIELRIITTSIAEAVAIVLGAELCWSLFSYVVEHCPNFGLLLILVVYPLPKAVATVRKHNALLDIIVTNLWLGWTVIGWFAVLIGCGLLRSAAVSV
jgi:hypothetical protein